MQGLTEKAYLLRLWEKNVKSKCCRSHQAKENCDEYIVSQVKHVKGKQDNAREDGA